MIARGLIRALCASDLFKIMSSVTTFPCPNCHEFINPGLEKCRHCSAPIDPQLADASLQLQEKVNSACNSASFIRNMAGVMWVFFFIGFIPFIKVAGAIGMLVLFILVPIRLIHWRIKYGGMQTEDRDYQRAKRNCSIALALWAGIILVHLAMEILYAGAIAFTEG